MKPGMKGGVDIEAALSQEGWAVRAVEEGKTWEKLARVIVRRILEGEQRVYRVGRELNSQKARVPQTIFPSSGSNYLSH